MKIIDSDAFLEMPLSTQALYFHLSMRADDDGFLNNAKKIMKLINANNNDYDILLSKRFIIQFPDGICVIKHWRINNYLRSDRYKETLYVDEKSMLKIKNNGSYTLNDNVGIPNCYQTDTNQLPDCSHCIPSIDKSSIDKSSIDKSSSRFTPPTLDEVRNYCKERNNTVDCERWYDFYESKGWMIGKNKMKDWKAAVRTWEKKSKDQSQKPTNQNKFNNFPQRDYTEQDLLSMEQRLLKKKGL